MNGPQARARGYRALAVALLVAHVGSLVVLAATTKVTTDEPNYLFAGVTLRRHLEWEAYNTILHGPLAFFPNQLFAWLKPTHPITDYAFWGRLGFIPFAAAAAWGLLRLAELAFGRATSLLAFTLYALNPIVLGHGCLMTADMALTCFYVLTVLQTWRYFATARARHLIGCGLALGCGLATKYLALFLVPVLAIAALIAAARGFRARLLWSRRPDAGPWRRVADLAPAAVTAGAVALLTLHTCYLWVPGGYVPRGAAPVEAASEQDAEDQSWGPKSASFRAIAASAPGRAALHLLPDPWVRGVDYQKFYSENGTTWFWHWVGPGFKSYYAVALGVKMPLAALLALAIGLALRNPRGARFSATVAAPAVAVPLVYLSCFTTLQIGVRYALMIVPLLSMYGGRGLAALWRWGLASRALALGVLALAFVEAARHWPRYVGAFNGLAQERPYLLFKDSNLDWRVAQLPDEDRDALRRRHPDAREVWANTGPSFGKLLVYGVELAPTDGRDRTRIYHWLRRFEPQDREGAWFVFEITEASFRTAVGAGTAGADPRGVAELAAALVGAGRADAALRALDGSQDADAERVRAAAAVVGTGDANARARALTELGAFEAALGIAGVTDEELRARALFGAHRFEDARAVLETVQAEGRLQGAAVYLLASCLHELGRTEAAIELLARHTPPADSPGRALHDRIVRSLANALKAVRLIESRAGGG
jgi:4-amino-4-deoxy-L-arabinose transferase-like glycosyltransferase